MVVAFHQLTWTFRRPTLLCFECSSIARNATELCVLFHISCPWSESSSTRLTTLFPLMPIVPFAINYILSYMCFRHEKGEGLYSWFQIIFFTSRRLLTWAWLLVASFNFLCISLANFTTISSIIQYFPCPKSSATTTWYITSCPFFPWLKLAIN